jgi:dTDP-4-dehydrorhamnose 3,5-epimerase
MKILKFSKNKDFRGIFKRIYCRKILSLKKINFDIKQVNTSFNPYKYTLRGLHYQNGKYAEDKLIYCTKGKFFFVSVNIDKKSKSYLSYKTEILSEDDDKILLIGKNHATGFLTLKKNTELIYLMSNFYNPKFAKGMMYDDKKIGINWPRKPLIISKKDLNFKSL